MSTFCVYFLAKHTPQMHKIYCRLNISLAYTVVFIKLGCGGYSQTLGQTICQAFLCNDACSGNDVRKGCYGCRRTGGKQQVYIKISEAEIADDYPEPKQYDKVHPAYSCLPVQLIPIGPS